MNEIEKTTEEVENKTNINSDELKKAKDIVLKIVNYYDSKIVGQKDLRLSLLVSLIANGHILLESVPGLAKTTAAKVLTESINGKFSRIQCTPDLLPSDIIGTQIFNYSNNKFETKLGPVNANFVLLDEINRSSSKTQSAMLEAMQERQVSIGGMIYKMPEIFLVVATQNPIEQEGTYLLAEAQLDRFIMKEIVKYPSVDEEIDVLNRVLLDVFSNQIENSQTATIDDVKFLQSLCKKVYVDDAIKKYIVNLINVTRNAKQYLPENLSKYIDFGASPRGSIALMQVGQAVALLNNRTHVIPDDIKVLRYSVLRHRINLNFEAIADDIKVETIIDAIFKAVETP